MAREVGRPRGVGVFLVIGTVGLCIGCGDDCAELADQLRECCARGAPELRKACEGTADNLEDADPQECQAMLELQGRLPGVLAMNGVGRSHVLLELLTRALAVAAPIGSLACSSCPPADPPALSRRDVDPSFADGGRLSAEQCQNVCGASNESTVITCVRDSPEKVMCITQVYSCDGGRRPAGLQDSAHAPCGALEGYLAEAARLEAASVAAFRVLRRELAAHGAPRWMLRAASRAARDERRHARTASALARSFGTSAALPRVEPRAVRELEAVALENVAEGCVRETWGALIALRQGRTAQVPAVRAAMGRIARDEVRHAALAWQVHRWASLRLSRAARARVESAKRTALRALAGEVVHELPGPARHALGLPDAAQSLALIAELERELWHPRG